MVFHLASGHRLVRRSDPSLGNVDVEVADRGLMALTIATGFVVDDAVVMIEIEFKKATGKNVMRSFDFRTTDRVSLS